MAKLNLLNMPRPAKIAIAIVPALVCAAVIMIMFVLPKSKQVKTLKADIEGQQNEIIKTQSMAARLDVLKTENEKLRARLNELSEQLPEEKEVSQLLRQVSDKGTDAGLQIMTWRTGGRVPHPSGIVESVPVNVTVTGGYHSFGRFLSSLTRLKRIVNISDIRLSNPTIKGDEAIEGISFVATTFVATGSGGLANATGAVTTAKKGR